MHPYRIYSICFVVTVFQFVLYTVAVEDLLLFWSQSKGISVLITLSTSEEFDCPITKGRTILSWRDWFILFTHFCDCSVKIELICRDNYSKNSFNRFQIGFMVYRQFSMFIVFELTSIHRVRSGKLDIWFQRIPTTSNLCPTFFVECLQWLSSISFQNQDQWMSIVLYQTFFYSKI